jgi:tetratricopeptide (TPR) repeat protein
MLAGAPIRGFRFVAGLILGWYDGVIVMEGLRSRAAHRCCAGLCGLVLAAATASSASAGDLSKQQLDKRFQAAVAEYDAGKLPQATTDLEALLPYAPRSFEIHELLGLVYAAQSLDAKAAEQFDAAVRLQPGSATARTNLAAALAHSGKPSLAAAQFRKALELAPRDYQANHNLGELYIESGRIAEAVPLLEKAREIDPSSYDNGYDLAQGYLLTGKNLEARRIVQALLLQKNTGELHALLAQIEEKEGNFVEAAKEFEAAAHLDPSEENLFNWGSEYLLHHTYDPAIEIFRQATQRYPKSPRLWMGLGMTLNASGRYEDAVKSLLEAADLDPSDPRCYFFLSHAYTSSPGQADEVIERFRRYAELQPRNALAVYYYAMGLWKGKRTEAATPETDKVQSLLEKAIALDPSLAEAHLQLGNLYADRRDYSKSIPQYLRTLELDPSVADAHYRLGQDYMRTGQKERGKAEFDIYQRLRDKHLADADKVTVQQFVLSAKAAPSAKP